MLLRNIQFSDIIWYCTESFHIASHCIVFCCMTLKCIVFTVWYSMISYFMFCSGNCIIFPDVISPIRVFHCDFQVLLNAFRILDKDGAGCIPVRDLCTKLASVGFDRWVPTSFSPHNVLGFNEYVEAFKQLCNSWSFLDRNLEEYLFFISTRLCFEMPGFYRYHRDLVTIFTAGKSLIFGGNWAPD